MFIPIGDQPNPRETPLVNYMLLIANMVIYVLITLPLMNQAVDPHDPVVKELLRDILNQHPGGDVRSLTWRTLGSMSAYDIFIRQWGYRPADPSVLSLFTSMFLHGGWMHLVGNMLFLWIYGDNVEARLGHWGYLIAYLASGAAATLSYAAFAPSSSASIPLVGASGAISGVLGFYFLWFPRNQVKMFVALFPFFFDVWLISARLVLGFYLIVENLVPYLLSSKQGGGVAHGAHIGGFFAGLVAAYVMNRFRGDQKTSQSSRRVPLNTPPPPSAARNAPSDRRPNEQSSQTANDCELVNTAVQTGRYEVAAHAYSSLNNLQKRKVPFATKLSLGDWSAQQEQPEAALMFYRHALTDYPRDPDISRAYLGIGLILLYQKKRPMGAYQYLMDALEADPAEDVANKARAALADIDRGAR